MQFLWVVQKKNRWVFSQIEVYLIATTTISISISVTSISCSTTTSSFTITSLSSSSWRPRASLRWRWSCMRPSSANISTTSWVQVAPQLTWDWLQVHEVTEPWTSTFTHLILTTAGFTEICYWWKFCINWTSSKPAIIELFRSTFGIFLTTKLKIC